MSLSALRSAIKKAATPARAKINAWFFKTGKGEYGYGDRFIGITVPVARRLARQYVHLPFREVAKLLTSPIHEERMIALFIMVAQFEVGEEKVKKQIFDHYLAATKHINNWDLVDLSAYKIVGPYLQNRSRSVLRRLAKSKNLWERRIAMVSTMHYIRQHDFHDAVAIAKQLLGDTHDLIHKAVGWLLREVGKRSETDLRRFLDTHAAAMPRTALRYALERLDPVTKQHYMYSKQRTKV